MTSTPPCSGCTPTEAASTQAGPAAPISAASGAPSRRSLLRGAAAGVIGGLVTVASADASTRYAFADPVDSVGSRGEVGASSAPADVLVVLSLRGGFDGLNVVVPAGDPEYAAARPTIGIPAARLLPLTGIFGAHPAMAPLMPWWASGDLAFVHAVGQASPSRSHFQAMAELERAAPGSALRTGWLDRTLGRGLGAASRSVFAGLQLGGSSVTGALAGPSPELSMRSIDSFEISGSWNDVEQARWRTALAALHKGAPAPIAGPAASTLAAIGTTAAMKRQRYLPAGGAVYPATPVGDALKDVARLIKARVGLRAACVDSGNWDMHARMGTVDRGWLADQVAETAKAMAAFATDLGPLLDGVTLVTLSEFGRRVRENGSGGVDHGHANAVMVLGGGVVGGQVYGRWPGLAAADLVDGDLAATTDYRDVLGEILVKRCGVPALGPVFPGLTPAPLGLVA